MIYSRIVVSVFFLFLFTYPGYSEETTELPTNIKHALHTIGKYLKEDEGTTWLSGLTAGRTSPLTTEQLMIEIYNSTEANNDVKTAAQTVRTSLMESRRSGSNESEVLELVGWKDLIDNVENQNDIICLYRKSINVSSERTEDWQKFLKNMANGYTVYLALDMGQKYVICLKAIQIIEQNSSTGERFNLTEPEVSIENSTVDLPSGSRSLNEWQTENSREDDKCNDKSNSRNVNMRRQLLPPRPMYHELPCNRPLIYMVPFGFYNAPWPGNNPTLANPMHSMIIPRNLSPRGPGGPWNYNYPVINPAFTAPGRANPDIPSARSFKIPSKSPESPYSIVKPLPSPPGIPATGYPLSKSINSASRLPNPGYPMIRNLVYPPKQPAVGYPIMRSTAVPTKSQPPGQYPNVASRKTLPTQSGNVYQTPNQASQLPKPPQSQGRLYFQPPRRFFQPFFQPRRIIQPIFQPGNSRLPDGLPWNIQDLPKSLPITDYQSMNYAAPNPNYYSSYSDQFANPNCRNYIHCAIPCNKPLLVKVLLESSQNPSNREFTTSQSSVPQFNAWRRNMDTNTNIEEQKNSDDDNHSDTANRNLNINNSAENSNENVSTDGSPESESSEVVTSISTVNEGGIN